MNNVYLHSKNNSQKLIIILLVMFVPYLLFGLYKNGISLYIHKLIDIKDLFKIIIIFLSPYLLTLIFKIIKKEKFLSYRLLLNVIISMITLPQTNILLYLSIVIILNIFYCFKKINISALYMIIYIIIAYLLKKYTFLNVYEASKTFNYTFLDLLIGKSYGGLANFAIIFLVASFIYLLCNIEYKKHISVTALITYYILLIIYFLISNNFSYDYFLNSNLLFSIIFISTISLFSPYTKGGCYIYGLLLGILCFIFIFIDINIGVYVTIFILSLLSPLFDKIITK